MLIKKFLLLISFLSLFNLMYSQKENCSINWDQETAKKVCDGVYGRIKKLNTGDFALVYSKGNSVYFRKSKDKCITWSDEVFVDGNNKNYNYTNSELIQLSNGTLFYCWNGRVVNQGGNDNYLIMYSLSYDYGNSWEKSKIIYEGGNSFENGCWEPCALELPNGTIQVYFANEAPYINSNEQEITMIESKDKCKTWNKPVTVSFREKHRDGMPVAIYLKESKTIALAIEDNGIDGLFKPAVISIKPDWTDLPIDGERNEREVCLKNENKLKSDVYAGAPYIIKIPNNRTLLSFQSTENREGENEKFAIMQVYIGDSNCHNFCNKTTPFENIPKNGSALWNSLCLIDNNTVIAVSSFSKNHNGDGVWTVRGNIGGK
ncbi:MAG: sialidase family protein [Bacteroidales bacterium]|nr:sialidase family protein [Bacteroidales bacterium]